MSKYHDGRIRTATYMFGLNRGRRLKNRRHLGSGDTCDCCHTCNWLYQLARLKIGNMKNVKW